MIGKIEGSKLHDSSELYTYSGINTEMIKI